MIVCNTKSGIMVKMKTTGVETLISAETMCAEFRDHRSACTAAIVFGVSSPTM